MGPYRFFFYASDHPKQAHVHVERDDKRAKLWLDPVRLHDGGELRHLELARIDGIVTRNQKLLRRAWDEYFGD